MVQMITYLRRTVIYKATVLQSQNHWINCTRTKRVINSQCQITSWKSSGIDLLLHLAMLSIIFTASFVLLCDSNHLGDSGITLWPHQCLQYPVNDMWWNTNNLCRMTEDIISLQAITSNRPERWMLAESWPAVGFSMKECNMQEQEGAPNPTSTASGS